MYVFYYFHFWWIYKILNLPVHREIDSIDLNNHGLRSWNVAVFLLRSKQVGSTCTQMPIYFLPNWKNFSTIKTRKCKLLNFSWWCTLLVVNIAAATFGFLVHKYVCVWIFGSQISVCRRLGYCDEICLPPLCPSCPDHISLLYLQNHIFFSTFTSYLSCAKYCTKCYILHCILKKDILQTVNPSISFTDSYWFYCPTCGN